MMDKRTNIINLVIGTRGTGKTTYLKGNEELRIPGIIDIYTENNRKQKILIVDLFDSPVWRDIPLMSIDKLNKWKSGIYRVYDRDFTHLVGELNKYCFNTILMFEDATKYVSGTLEEDLKQLLIDSKQKNLDVFFAFHYLNAVPPSLARISDYIVLFKTNESWTSQLRNKYPHPEIERAFKRVTENKDYHYYETIALI